MDAASYFTKNFVLETDRLIIRRIATSDASDMYEYAHKSETSQYLLWSPHPYYSYTLDLIRYLQKQYAQGKFYDLAIVFKETQKMIGTVGFTTIDEKTSCCEVGYVLNPDYWGRGIATEALNALLNFAFCELGFNRVEARYFAQNIASRRVMDKCGFTFEGIQRNKLLVKNVFRDIGVCSILSTEYFSTDRQNLYKSCNCKGLIKRLFHKN